MSVVNFNAGAPVLRADDAEIERYAMLLDCLGVALLVYASDAEVCLSNAQARAMLNDGPALFTDESGIALTEENQPAAAVLRSRCAIHNRVLGVNDAGAPSRWVNANVLPVFADDGSIRRVLLSMSDVSERRWLEAKLEQLSVRDPLTDAFNRRHTLYLLDEECQRARRYGTPSTIALIDIDRFREINETHGRAMGDRVLSGVARRIREALRGIDIVGRYGGGEFLLILPNVHLDGAMIPLERIRAQIASEVFDNLAGVTITISGGVTECAGDTTAALTGRAHALLLQAKDAGRNQLCQDVEIF
jgi:diguanylate cyclase (GGDEF)-like protein